MKTEKTNEQQQEQNIKKEILNLNISSEIVEKTEELIFNLKKQLPREKRKKLTRSRFFELLLESVIHDYENRRADSDIQKIIGNWINLI